MSQRVYLPPGCMGFKASDGTRYVAKPGTSVVVEDHHMPALRNQEYASAGLVDAGAEKFFVKKGPEGRFCNSCPNNTVWHAWTKVCPKCGADTIPESEMSLPKLEEYIP
jgi:hypothetical protein